MASQRRKVKTRTQKEYGLEERTKAVAAMLAVSPDHPLSYAAQDAARAVLGAHVAKGTLHRWHSELMPTITSLQPALATKTDLLPIINAGIQEATSRLDKIVEAYEDHLLSEDVIKKSSSRDAGVVMGIARDHRYKEASIPPEIVARLKRFEELATAANIPLADALDTIIHQIELSNSKRLIDTLATRLDPPSE